MSAVSAAVCEKWRVRRASQLIRARDNRGFVTQRGKNCDSPDMRALLRPARK